MRHLRRRARGWWVAGLAAACSALAATPAAADPVTYDTPNGNGAAVTVQRIVAAPGGTLRLTGTGYQPGQWVVVKLDDDSGGTAGGADVAPTQVSGWPTFAVRADGAFTGTVTLPTDLEPTGEHWLRLLSGSQPAPAPEGGWKISSIQAFFSLVAQDAWVTSGPAAPGGTVAYELAGFTRDGGGGQRVTVHLDGGPAIDCVTAEADGTAAATLTLPADLATGTHTLSFATGTGCDGEATEPPARTAEATFAVAAAPAVTVTLGADTVVAGGAVAVDGHGFAADATVAVELDGTPLTTMTADGAGAITGTVTIPASTAAGAHELRFSAGAASVTASIAVTSPPVAPPATGVGVVVTTPVIAPGGQVGFVLSGFRDELSGLGQLVGIRIDDSRDLAGCVATDATGAAVGAVGVAADIAPGAHTIRFLAGTACVSGGPLAQPPARSLVAGFAVTGAAGTPGGSAPDAGSVTAPPTDGAGGPGAGGASTSADPTPAPRPQLRSTKLRLRHGRVRLSLRSAAAWRGAVTISTAQRVRVKRKLRHVMIVRPTGVRVAAGRRTVTLRATRAGRRLVRSTDRRLRVRIRIVRSDGATVARRGTLR